MRFSAAPLLATVLGVVIAIGLWLIFFRPANLASRGPSNCEFDGGRRIATPLITICMPPEAYATTNATATANRVEFLVAGADSRLILVSNPDGRSSILDAGGTEPEVKVSRCREFEVVDSVWKRPGGWQARQIVAGETIVGYDWSLPPAPKLIDTILNTWACREPGSDQERKR